MIKARLILLAFISLYTYSSGIFAEVNKGSPAAFNGFESVIGLAPASPSNVDPTQVISQTQSAPVKPVITRDEMLNKRSGALPSAAQLSSPVPQKPVVSSSTDASPTNSVFYNSAPTEQNDTESSTELDTGSELSSRHYLLRSGQNKVIPVSRGQFNRIVTPFDDPQVLTTAPEEEVIISPIGNVIQYATNLKRPIGIYVSPKSNPSLSISLTLFARDILPREVIVDLEGYDEIKKAEQERSAQLNNREKANSFEHQAANDYLKWIYDFVRVLVSGDVPQGYSLATPTGRETCKMPGLDISIKQIMKGANYNVEVFQATNSTKQKQDIVESYCWSPDVVAIVPWETPQVDSGASIELLIIKKITEIRSFKRARFL